jgi:transcriptional regulator with XRE-family HTH domain
MAQDNPPVDPERLRAARLRAGLTQAELARAVGVAGGERVSRWELGTSAPSIAMRARLAKALGLDLEELLPARGRRDLRRLRGEAGLTVAELAAQGGVSTGTIKRWEAGSGLRVRAPLENLAAALGVSVATLREAIEFSATDHR